MRGERESQREHKRAAKFARCERAPQGRRRHLKEQRDDGEDPGGDADEVGDADAEDVHGREGQHDRDDAADPREPVEGVFGHAHLGADASG